MNKMKILIISVILFLLITIVYSYPNKLQKEENMDTSNYSTILSFLLQNESDNDSYTLSRDKTWPKGNYILNKEKSYCENGGELSYDTSKHKVSVLTAKADRCFVYFDKYNPKLFAEYIKGLYLNQGDNGLYLHDNTLINGTGDGSYRYAGANPNNYVCFGSTDNPCPEDNLYRIIGVFGNQVKLIKADYTTKELLGEDGDYASNITPQSTYKGSQSSIANYYWNASTNNGGTANNNWNESRLNTVNLNTNFLNNIGESWAEKIDKTTWYVGGIGAEGVTTNAQTTYNYELGTNANKVTYEAKVGLMYVSEYYYGALPTYWALPGRDSNENDYRKATSENWLYLGDYEWTITSRSAYSNFAFFLRFAGYGDGGSVNSSYGIRPSFSLKSDVLCVGGSGTKSDPMVIN